MNNTNDKNYSTAESLVIFGSMAVFFVLTCVSNSFATSVGVSGNGSASAGIAGTSGGTGVPAATANTGVSAGVGIHAAPTAGAGLSVNSGGGTGVAPAPVLPPPAGSVTSTPQNTPTNAYNRTFNSSGGVSGTSCTAIAHGDGRC